jgi:hypothetical protein
MYGAAERLLSDGLDGQRDQVFIVDKGPHHLWKLTMHRRSLALPGDGPPEGSVSMRIAELALAADGGSAAAGHLLLPGQPRRRGTP